MTADQPHHIAIEGVIGVGKTSLAKRLAERLEAGLLLEEAADNPFLNDFYRDRKRFALPTQIFFLLARYQQQQRLVERDLFVRQIISDYMFEKDVLFASVNLAERELALYHKMAEVLKRDVANPDLVLYLQASTPVLMGRIRKRSRPIEKGIDNDYIDALNEAYNSFFFHYNEAPLLVINTDKIDFVSRPEHLDDLVEQIKKPHSGTVYYSPAGDLGTGAL
ncbi:MAG: deoxynucleoside kinase [candidate division Zixibacteria bacterium]|nr:deoxynucleoside kinase [candidate division Zixibacteria bacterium]